jgi:iron complex outermembrane receptor protein
LSISAKPLKPDNYTVNRLLLQQGSTSMKVRSISMAGVTLVATNLANVPLAHSAEPTASTTQTIVVTATRVQESSFDLPVSVDVVNQSQLQDQQLQVNLSESLARIPGIVAQNRQNYAQDLQISSRGFGARSTFGVRGIRLYADGIPATMPDGQGQVSNFDIGSAGRLEVMRGPFSALYGNSSGGVISIFTEDGKPGSAMEVDAAYGSYGTHRIGAKASGDKNGINYVVDASEFSTDGYRAHSAVTRDTYNAKLSFKPDEASKVTIVANSLDMPEAQDPLGLDRGQFNSDPRQAGTSAVLYNTRKRVQQTQGGVNYERTLSAADSLAATFYYGRRSTTQFQSIPTTSQGATSAGGVIDLIRNYGGLDMRWIRRTTLAGEPLRFTAGVNYENVDERRRGFLNFTGPSATPTVRGIFGVLHRDEDNRVFNFDQYVQAEWQPSKSWLVLAGVRNSSVKVGSLDHYTVVNANDSGNTSYSATSPVAGITFKASDALNLYVSFGSGFETPTLNELSYRTSPATGLNFALKPAKSDHVEIGAKAFLGPDVKATAAIFNVKTHDEIGVLTNTGGRSVFQNVGGTTRDGVELSLDARLPRGFGAYAAYTYLRATYDNRFMTCFGSPCALNQEVPVAAGNAIPGIPRSTVYGEVTWKDAPTGFASGLELRHSTAVYVNDLNSDAAPAYTVANVRFGFDQEISGWHLKEFVRVDNLSDRKYAGSVIVNEGNSRFFEPAPGRTHLIGVSAAYNW